RPEMAHLDVDAAVRARAPGLHLRVDGATDDVAGGALEVCVIVGHEAVHRAVEWPPAPRSPSSSTVPVMRVSAPASSPVGWNWTISMSRRGSPARSAIASPSMLLSPDGVW